MSDTPSRVETLSKLATAGAQIAGLLGIASLAGALLYNWTFFTVVDQTLMSAFTISDHIATAIELSPYVVALTAFLLWRGSRQGADDGNSGRVVLLVSVALAIVSSVIASRLGNATAAALLIFLGLVMGWAWGGDRWLVSRLIEMSPEGRLGARFAAAIVIMIVALGICIGMMTGQSQPTHRIELPGEGAPQHIDGRMVQILERGAIVLALPQRTWMFIPKDQIRRIEKITR